MRVGEKDVEEEREDKSEEWAFKYLSGVEIPVSRVGVEAQIVTKRPLC